MPKILIKSFAQVMFPSEPTYLVALVLFLIFIRFYFNSVLFIKWINILKLSTMCLYLISKYIQIFHNHISHNYSFFKSWLLIPYISSTVTWHKKICPLTGSLYSDKFWVFLPSWSFAKTTVTISFCLSNSNRFFFFKG